MNSKVNYLAGQSLSAILESTVKRGLIIDTQDSTQVAESVMPIILNKVTNQFLENQSVALKISKHDLINLILDSIVENTVNLSTKVPSRWSVF